MVPIYTKHVKWDSFCGLFVPTTYTLSASRDCKGGQEGEGARNNPATKPPTVYCSAMVYIYVPTVICTTGTPNSTPRSVYNTLTFNANSAVPSPNPGGCSHPNPETANALIDETGMLIPTSNNSASRGG